MAYRFPDAWLNDLRDRLNIVDIVSEYVQLKPKGRNFWGLCPFHNEKTASFSVSEDNQMFYCFGCHKGGNVIHFVMEIERMEFLDAIEHLAEKARLPMPEKRAALPMGESRETKEKIYEANKAAARIYHDRIWTSEGAEGLKYLYKRGLTDVDVRRFGLGFADSAGDDLTRELEAQGFDEEVLIKAGLTGKKDDRVYDVFRKRVIFPIVSGQLQVLGFGGRAMGDDQPKYLNTSETPVFNKRRELYPMNLLRKERSLDHLILVEGYMDVIALRRRGIQGVVATLGTALTSEQARLAARYSKEIIVCYDGDDAGQRAILRALTIFKESDARVKVLSIPGKMDPDEYIVKYGREGFEALKPTDPAIYQMKLLEKDYDLSEQEGRTQYAIACCLVIRESESPVERENYIKALALKTGFDRETLMEQIGVPMKRKAARGGHGGLRNRPSEEIREHVRAEKTLVLLLAYKLVRADMVSVEDFETPHYAAVAKRLMEGGNIAAALDELNEDQRTDVAKTVNVEIIPDEKEALVIAQDCMRSIRRHRIDENIEQLKSELAGADSENKRELTGKIAELMVERQRLMTGRKE